MKKLSVYRVYWMFNNYEQSGDEYIEAFTAQGAVDVCREVFAPEGAEILDVAKVVNNWK